MTSTARRRTRARRVVERLVDHRLHPRREPLDHPGREHLLHEPPEARVVGRIDVEDPAGAPLRPVAEHLLAELGPRVGADRRCGPRRSASGRAGAGRSRRSGTASTGRTASAAPGWRRTSSAYCGYGSSAKPGANGLKIGNRLTRGFRLTGHISHTWPPARQKTQSGDDMSTIVEVVGPRGPRFAGQPHRRGRGRAALGRTWARHRPERCEHRRARGASSCVTAASATAARASAPRSSTSTRDRRRRRRPRRHRPARCSTTSCVTLDGTDGKRRLGANAILGVSLAAAKAAADEAELPLYRYVGGANAHVLPVPFMNVLNGGAHADSNVDLQEFMLAPVGAASFAEALRWGVETYHALEGAAARAWPVDRARRRRRLRAEPAVERGGARAAARARSSAPATRPATRSRSRSTSRRPSFVATRRTGRYVLAGEGADYSPVEWADRLVELCDRYPIVSIEDGMAEDDWDGWAALTRALGARVQLVGDDLFVTNVERLQQGIDRGVANSILVKVNQIGTLSETLDTMFARRSPRLHRDDVAPQRRDRRRHHRRPRGRHQLRSDQDRRARAQRPRRQVQPAPAHRGGARPGGRRTSARRALPARVGGAVAERPRRRRARAEVHATRSRPPSRREVEGGAAEPVPAEARRAASGAPAAVDELALLLVVLVGLLFAFVYPTRTFLDQRADTNKARTQLERAAGRERARSRASRSACRPTPRSSAWPASVRAGEAG